jgi:hypothetical protein
VAPQVVGFEQHAPAEPLVPFDVAGDCLGRFEVGRRMFTSVTGGPSGAPSAPKRVTERCSNWPKAPTLSGVRCRNRPTPPLRIPRPSGKTPTVTPPRGDQFTRWMMSSRSRRRPSSG